VPQSYRPARSARPAPARSAPSRGRRRPTSSGTKPAVRVAAPSVLDQALTASAESPAPEALSFARLGLAEKLVTTLARRGIETPSPIQARALPDALAGRDVLGPRPDRLRQDPRLRPADAHPARRGPPYRPAAPAARPRARPTRELAEQVKEALAPLAHTLNMRVTAIYGGASMKRQIDALERGVDVVVATPGRLEDHIQQGFCRLSSVEVTALDEADYMADLGFLPAVTRLLDAVPAGTQRLLFSATLDRGVEGLVHKYLVDPAIHAVAQAATKIETMDHQAFTVDREHKVAVAAEIAARPGRTLLFVRTKHGADRLAKQLTNTGVEAGAIHGDLRQSQRQRALDAFSSGHARVLVATDVAAAASTWTTSTWSCTTTRRTTPRTTCTAAGRTARAGSSGTVLSLLLPGRGPQRRAHAPLARASRSTRSIVGSGHSPCARSRRPVSRSSSRRRRPRP
jgi:superfamily II DNA/RNA helicase